MLGPFLKRNVVPPGYPYVVPPGYSYVVSRWWPSRKSERNAGLANAQITVDRMTANHGRQLVSSWEGCLVWGEILNHLLSIVPSYAWFLKKCFAHFRRFWQKFVEGWSCTAHLPLFGGEQKRTQLRINIKDLQCPWRVWLPDLFRRYVNKPYSHEIWYCASCDA